MNQLTLEQKQAISMAEKGLSIKMLAFAGGGKTSTLYAIANAQKNRTNVDFIWHLTKLLLMKRRRRCLRT